MESGTNSTSQGSGADPVSDAGAERMLSKLAGDTRSGAWVRGLMTLQQ